MDENKIDLSWDKFDSNAAITFRQLWINKEFTDVTLVTGDDLQIKAHKVILSSSSEFFRRLLLKNPQHHVEIFLKDVKYKELEMIMKYIYLGQCEVGTQELTEFLVTGNDLEINSLMEYIEQNYAKDFTQGNECMNSEPQREAVDKNNDKDIEEIKSEITVVENDIGNFPQDEKQERGKLDCKECPAVFKRRFSLREHTLSIHKGVRYDCDQCAHRAKSRGRLYTHIKSIHSGVMYNCNQCDLKVTTQSGLRIHMQSIHEGVRYGCDQCSYKATAQCSLNRHVQAKHERLRYNCDRCHYTFSDKGGLKKHINSQHEGVYYTCDLCGYKAFNLGKHIKSKHGEVCYNCDLCDYKAIHQKSLTKHTQSQHKYSDQK